MMKFALTILVLFASASLVLAQFPSAPSSPKISPKCMNVLLKLLQDEELTKCLPISQIVISAVSGGPSDAYTLIEEFKDVGDKICPAPMCSDSLIKEKVSEGASACSAELESLQMTSDQVIDLAVQAYADIYELLCFKNSSGALCIDETADNLGKYKDTPPPPEVICTPCNQAMFGVLKKLINLVDESPIGKTINLDPEGLVHEDKLKSTCGDEFVSGNVPDTIKDPSSSGGGDSPSNSSSSSSTSNSTSDNGPNGDGSSSKGDAKNSSHGNKSSNGNTTKTDSEADSANILQVMRSEYFVFSVIAMFAALL